MRSVEVSKLKATVAFLQELEQLFRKHDAYIQCHDDDDIVHIIVGFDTEISFEYSAVFPQDIRERINYLKLQINILLCKYTQGNDDENRKA